MFYKRTVLKNFVILTGKHPCRSLFFNIGAGLLASKFIKKSLQQWCFPVKFAKFLVTLFFREHLRWLLLDYKCNVDVIYIPTILTSILSIPSAGINLLKVNNGNF